MITERECQSALFQVAIKNGVSPELIKTRLLSDQDKNDLREGLLPISSLNAFVEVWKASGMPDYAHGKDIPYNKEKMLMGVIDSRVPYC